MTQPLPPPGWYQDPTEQGEGRYWSGTAWTESVLRGGVVVEVPIDPSRAQLPPFAGTEISVAVSPSAPAPPAEPAPRRGGSSGVLVGVLGFAVVILVVVVVVLAVTGDDSSDTPPPGTDAPPATEAPPAEDDSDGG